MKLIFFGTLLAVAAASVPVFSAQNQCIAYGDETAEFTWRLCPNGEKYERQYLYYGFWSEFYPVESNAGECRWAAARSTWLCPDGEIYCDRAGCRGH